MDQFFEEYHIQCSIVISQVDKHKVAIQFLIPGSFRGIPGDYSGISGDSGVFQEVSGSFYRGFRIVPVDFKVLQGRFMAFKERSRSFRGLSGVSGLV